jgi:hypothetical protein
MDHLGRLRQAACSLDVRDFVTAHEGLYLLGIYPEQDDDEADGSMLTSHGRPWALSPSALGVRVPESAADIELRELQRLGIFLLRIEKSFRNPWKGRISVGRAANNDMVIHHASVSKLHAHFLIAEGQSGVPTPLSLQIADAGSKNGTRKNGQTLATGESRVVGSGDVLHFGEVRCDLFAAAALHEQIRRRFPTRELRESTGRPG